jgi:arginase
MIHRSYRILHAPSPLGLKPPAVGRVPGVRLMPEALRRAGLHEALGASIAGEVEPPPYVADRDPAFGVRNAHSIARYSVALADAIEPMLDGIAFPLVLGGDCSILLGAALALRRRGRFGVVYIDGHSDCQTPESSATGGVAGMPLAIATGTGPSLLTELEGRGPYIAESDAVLVGCRDLFDVTGSLEKRVKGTRIRVHDLNEVRRLGPARVAEEALRPLVSSAVDGIWLHLDVDVLDPAIMPAVDSPDPGGLTVGELAGLLGPLLQAPLVKGMQVTIYDPERDTDGRAASVVVDVLKQAALGRVV